jgi:Helix-turn-helix domain
MITAHWMTAWAIWIGAWGIVAAKTNRRWCDSCAERLPNSSTDALCEPCSFMARPEFRPLVTEEFYDRPEHAELRQALAKYDFGPLLRAVRWECDQMSQERLGLLVGAGQGTISRVENGEARLDAHSVVNRVTRALGIPGRLLDPCRSSTNDGTVSGVDRRGFNKAVGASATALAGAALGLGAELDLDRLKGLLPDSDREPAPQRIGAADVAAIEQATAMYRTSHHERGGGLMRATAVAQLGHVLNLQKAQCTEQVRANLLMATAALAKTAAWMSLEASRYPDAQNLRLIALQNARKSGHPLGTDLMVASLMDAASQAMHLGNPREMLELVDWADGLMATRKGTPVSATTRCYVQNTLAMGQAAMGGAELSLRALDQAGQTLADADPTTSPPWSSHISEALHSARRGRSLLLLSRTTPAYADAAVQHLRVGTAGLVGPSRAALRAVSLPALAASYALTGDLDSAVTTGHEALTLAEGLADNGPHPWLCILADVTEPHTRRPDVADLRHRIHQVLPAAAV